MVNKFKVLHYKGLIMNLFLLTFFKGIRFNSQKTRSVLGHSHNSHDDADAADDGADDVRQEAQVNDGDQVKETTLGRLKRRIVVTSGNRFQGTDTGGGRSGEHDGAENDNEDDPEAGDAGVADVGSHQKVSLTIATSNDTEDTGAELKNVDEDTEHAQSVPVGGGVDEVAFLKLAFSEGLVSLSVDKVANTSCFNA